LAKRKSILITVILIIFFLALWIYKYNQYKNYGKLTPQENAEIISIVNSYFDCLKNKDYKGALEKIDLSKEDYNNDLEKWNNRDAKGYDIQQVNDGHWTTGANGKHDYVLYYEDEKIFAVDTVDYFTYNGRTNGENQIVYVKRFGKEGFKICNILTDMKPYIDCSYVIH